MSQNFQVFAWDRRSRLIGFPDFAGSIIRIPEFSRRVPEFSGASFCRLPGFQDFPECRSVPIQFPNFPECRFADYPDSRIFHHKTVWTCDG